MTKSKQTKANKSNLLLDADSSDKNLGPSSANSDKKITVRRDGDKVVVSVPVRFYRAMAGR